MQKVHKLFLRASICLQTSQEEGEDIKAMSRKVDWGKKTEFREKGGDKWVDGGI